MDAGEYGDLNNDQEACVMIRILYTAGITENFEWDKRIQKLTTKAGMKGHDGLSRDFVFKINPNHYLTFEGVRQSFHRYEAVKLMWENVMRRYS